MGWIRIVGVGLVALFVLSGCSRLSLSDAATGTGAAIGAAAGAASGLGTAVTLTTTAIGATAGAVVLEDTAKTIAADTIKEVTNPWQAMVIAWNDLLNHAFEIVIALMVGVFAIPMVLTFVIGKIMPNRKTKEVEQENKVLKKLMEK